MATDDTRKRELSVNTFVTLDGVMQAPGGPEEDPSHGFGHGGWSAGYWDERMMEVMGAQMAEPFDLVLGRGTYEIFAAHWPHTDEPGAELFNDATKYVASATRTELEWQNSHLLEAPAHDAVAALKQQDGPELQVHGSAGLIQTLLEHDLVDVFRIWTFPLVLGTGKRLFGAGTVPAGMELIGSTTSSTGVIVATYRTGADIRSGSFALEEPSEAELQRRAARGV